MSDFDLRAADRQAEREIAANARAERQAVALERIAVALEELVHGFDYDNGGGSEKGVLDILGRIRGRLSVDGRPVT